MKESSHTNPKLLIIFTTLSFYLTAAAAHSPAAALAATPASSQSEKDEFLKAHNELRAKMQEPELMWDTMWEEYARKYGAQRAVQDCRLEHLQGPYGENLFFGGGASWTPRDAVVEWVQEDKSYDAKTNSCQPGQQCGHYTQIIWKSSCKLGCVKFLCKSGYTCAICEYDPPGNYVGENPLDGVTDESDSISV